MSAAGPETYVCTDIYLTYFLSKFHMFGKIFILFILFILHVAPTCRTCNKSRQKVAFDK